MIWQTDGFALAASYDEEVGRYVDLWVPSPVGDKTPPAPLDSMLIVRPDKAERQIGSEKQQSADDGHMGTSATTTVSSEDGVFTPTTTMTTGASDVSQTYVRLVKNAKYRARFEVDTSAADSIGAAVVKAVEEVLRHIVTDEGVENVEFVLDIRAENSSGFSESAVRTVKENSRVLGFDISEFEDVEW